jgi:hypothetical protein
MTAATFEAILFEHLTTLFNGSSAVRDFRHWFSSASWESDDALPDELYELASGIEHLGYIRDSGIWDDATYLQNLQTEVDVYRSGLIDHRAPRNNNKRKARVA